MELPSLDFAEVALRIGAAGLLGGLIGFERELHDQAAGFRTHILVSLGAALFTMVGAYGATEFFGDSPSAARLDPTRVAAQIVTGIGFLGAGAILRQGINIRGLTTAAGLWVTAAVGTAAGLGYWSGALATTAVALVALFGLKPINRTLISRLRSDSYRFVIQMDAQFDMSNLAAAVRARGTRFETLKVAVDERGNRQVTAAARVPEDSSPEDLAQRIAELDGVEDVDWSRTKLK